MCIMPLTCELGPYLHAFQEDTFRLGDDNALYQWLNCLSSLILFDATSCDKHFCLKHLKSPGSSLQDLLHTSNDRYVTAMQKPGT